MIPLCILKKFILPYLCKEDFDKLKEDYNLSYKDYVKYCNPFAATVTFTIERYSEYIRCPAITFPAITYSSINSQEDKY